MPQQNIVFSAISPWTVMDCHEDCHRWTVVGERPGATDFHLNK